MKKTILFLALCAACAAATVRFAWDDGVNPAGRVSYRFYVKAPVALDFALSGTATNLTYTLTTSIPGTYRARVTAVVGGIESDPSNEVEFWVPSAPRNIAIVIAP